MNLILFSVRKGIYIQNAHTTQRLAEEAESWSRHKETITKFPKSSHLYSERQTEKPALENNTTKEKSKTHEQQKLEQQ